TVNRLRATTGGVDLGPLVPRLRELIGTKDRKVNLTPPDFLSAVRAVRGARGGGPGGAPGAPPPPRGGGAAARPAPPPRPPPPRAPPPPAQARHTPPRVRGGAGRAPAPALTIRR
ncbi:hypothetical protein, partial [Nocardia neocaledoniensis]|uniref:hypothetical protein n=1 Tax=Nocardia neocaledoniensis TaxID=236511 RepID=UPI002458A9D3